ncbi:hypothetical protein C808_00680 [Lachnospiraceae bacterium M18-1]|nr:hypothetical protein C808_00680 [Lachnospiraceae bacterium M18-1]
MKRKQKTFYTVLVISTLAIVSVITLFYIRQLDQTISDNIISEISEIAEHDKSTIQAYIEICWTDLYEIQERFARYDCRTTAEIQEHLDLECTVGDFTRLCLVAEDGTVYTDGYEIFPPEAMTKYPNFMTYFANDNDRFVTRLDEENESGDSIRESILYGIRLDNFQVDGIRMYAMVGMNDISSIQDKMVIDCFTKNGENRGHSALIDMEGNYIVDINKKVYQNEQNNLFMHLSESRDSELTNEEVAQKFAAHETFAFYHSHIGEKYKELFYFIPFDEKIRLYFIMSVNEAVFREQTRTFFTMSMIMLIISILTILSMLLIVMRYQIKTIRASEKEKSQKEFLSNMSHEIRTPLNGLIGMNHLIMMHIDDSSRRPQIMEWLRKSHSTAQYLLSLVNDVLDMSKLQAGKVDIINEPMMVDALVDEIAAMQADNIRSRGVEFIVEKDVIEPCIEGDDTRIKQILMNIVGNAAKFTPAGRSIRLSVRQEKTDDMHVVTFYRCQDTGIGMSRDYIGKIFDTFSQEQNQNTSGITGTGLGMPISKLLANAMGGDITVESELYAGSTFTVAVPSVIVKDVPDYLKGAAENGTADDSLREQKAPGPCKILVAEDVELNAEILIEILSMEGFETAHARNGREAVELFRESEIGEFGIILMDMQMPVMDGCEASLEIRKLDRTDAQSVQIYACTANTFQEDRDLALESGMNDFLTKPIDIEVLLKKMAAV